MAAFAVRFRGHVLGVRAAYNSTGTETVMVTGVAFESGRAVIRCKYYGPTNTRGSRIRVSRFDPPAAGSDPNRVSVGWDHSLGLVPNYVAAVQAYLDRAGWSGSWAVSTVTDGAVAVYVPGSDGAVAR